tara:strand:- start:880 stop:1137 length:258 start_codon:yes stop_codon:yes gene_type:complete
MRKEISEYEIGECVAIDNAVRGTLGIVIKDVAGIVLNKELIELDENISEWLYTISLPNMIDDFWPYEIKPVNFIEKTYNTVYGKT